MEQETIHILISAGAGLLGALIGGLTSFFAPLVVEKVKFKREQENSKMVSYYIPICKAVEELLEQMNNYLKLPDNALNFDKLYEYYSNCHIFLKAEYRLQLSNNVLKSLNSFCCSFDNFVEELATRTSNYCTDIERMVSQKMIPANNNDEFCNYDLYDESSNSIKRMFICNKFFSHLVNIKSVDVVLVMNIDGEEDCTWVRHNNYYQKNDTCDPDIEMENDMADKLTSITKELQTTEKAYGENFLKTNTIQKEYLKLIKQICNLKKTLYRHIDRYK